MLEAKEMRAVYCDTMIALAEKHPEIVVLDADLSGACGTKPFAQRFPKRYFNVGVAEANMTGVAAGMAACGKQPFIHSFCPFVTRRNFDQLAISVAFAGLGVRMVGVDPGICAEANGATHMPFEDMAIMRTLPGMLLFEPVDSVQLTRALPQIAQYEGPVYVRMHRKKADLIFDETRPASFTLGKAITLQQGNDVSIFASGIMVHTALEAAVMLAEKNISAEVVNIHTWQPLDAEAVLASAHKTGAVVTAENHGIIGGLGGAVAELLGENLPRPMRRVGVHGRFGEVGTRASLAQTLGLTAADIVAAALDVIRKK